MTSSKSKTVNRPKPILSDSSSDDDEDKGKKVGRKSSEKKQKVTDKSSKSNKRAKPLSDSGKLICHGLCLCFAAQKPYF